MNPQTIDVLADLMTLAAISLLLHHLGSAAVEYGRRRWVTGARQEWLAWNVASLAAESMVIPSHYRHYDERAFRGVVARQVGKMMVLSLRQGRHGRPDDAHFFADHILCRYDELGPANTSLPAESREATLRHLRHVVDDAAIRYFELVTGTRVATKPASDLVEAA